MFFFGGGVYQMTFYNLYFSIIIIIYLDKQSWGSSVCSSIWYHFLFFWLYYVTFDVYMFFFVIYKSFVKKQQQSIGL